MTSSFAVLLICVLAHSVSSTRFTEQLNNQPTNRQLFPAFEIVGSNQTNISMFPYTVSISYNGSLLGSGAILNKHWILCSASQLESCEKDVLTVRAGSDYYSTGGQAVHTGKIFVNEHYTGDFPYNVAIIKLNGSINFSAKAKPVRIAASPPKAGCKASVTGWGKQSPTKDSGNRLQVAHITVKPVAECQASHPTIDVGKVICADADGVGHCNFTTCPTIFLL